MRRQQCARREVRPGLMVNFIDVYGREMAAYLDKPVACGSDKVGAFSSDARPGPFEHLDNNG